MTISSSRGSSAPNFKIISFVPKLQKDLILKLSSRLEACSSPIPHCTRSLPPKSTVYSGINSIPQSINILEMSPFLFSCTWFRSIPFYLFPFALFLPLYVYRGCSRRIAIDIIMSSPSTLQFLQRMENSCSIPEWIESLLGEKFFNSCLLHESEKRNDENTFCLDCCINLCTHCLPPHQGHYLLQIRRYVYQDVLRLKDAEKLMDCSFVQPYKTNSEKVVFLHERPITTQPKGSSWNHCIVCGRSLQLHYLFCSISCKVHDMIMRFQANMENQLFYKSERALEIKEDQEQGSPESVLELPLSLKTSSLSSSRGEINSKSLLCTATKSLASVTGFCENRRKGVPHRSPLS